MDGRAGSYVLSYYVKHHAIIVTDEYGDYLERAHEVATRIFRWVSPISPIATNCVRSFLVPPDGAFENTALAAEAAADRKRFVEYLQSLAYADGGPPLVWIEVEFGEFLASSGKGHACTKERHHFE